MSRITVDSVECDDACDFLDRIVGQHIEHELNSLLAMIADRPESVSDIDLAMVGHLSATMRYFDGDV